MEQFILHLIGDFILQTDKMATKKITNTYWAIAHGILYTIPFILLTKSIYALWVICITHILIDRFRLVRYLIYFKNKITDSSLEWKKCKATGYPIALPSWLSFILLLLTDGTSHLIINYLSIKYL